jgi:hypothetical protein
MNALTPGPSPVRGRGERLPSTRSHLPRTGRGGQGVRVASPRARKLSRFWT